MIFLFFALAVVQQPTQLPTPPSFHLVCNAINDATATHVNIGTASVLGHFGTAVGTSSEHYQTAPEEMLVDIVGETGKMRPPPRMVNHVWHKDGWLNLTDVTIGSDEIAAKVQFSWASHPRVSIDRRTGSIYYTSLMGSYSGHCQPIDSTTHAF